MKFRKNDLVYLKYAEENKKFGVVVDYDNNTKEYKVIWIINENNLADFRWTFVYFNDLELAKPSNLISQEKIDFYKDFYSKDFTLDKYNYRILYDDLYTYRMLYLKGKISEKRYKDNIFFENLSVVPDPYWKKEKK